MCFAPQRRTFFEVRTWKSAPNPTCFGTFWLENALRATAACHFSRVRTWKVLRTQCVLHILTYKCASRHSGVPFFDIITSRSASELRCFIHFHFKIQNVLFATAVCNFWFLLWPHDSAPAALTSLLLDLTRHTNHWKNAALRDFSNIWRGCIFFLLTSRYCIFLLLTLLHLICFSSAFQLSILWESLLSKLPSMSNETKSNMYIIMIVNNDIIICDAWCCWPVLIRCIQLRLFMFHPPRSRIRDGLSGYFSTNLSCALDL